jgi:hypothetical protein
MHRLLNFAAFYTGWITCVLGAAAGRFWLGPALVAVLLVAHLSSTADPKSEGRLIATVGFAGFVLESVMASVGLYSFIHTGSHTWLCPPWMVALWLIFASTLNGSLAWLADRYTLAAMVGAVAGPISYFAGARLGAIALPPSIGVSVIGLGLVWAMIMPTLLWLRGAMRRMAN